MIKRNTIIILGNGFDIANNLPTRYADFADNQLKKISKKLTTDFYNTSISASFHDFFKIYSISGRPNTKHVNYKVLLKLVRLILSKDKGENEILTFLQSHLEYLSSIISNSFLARLFSNNYINWFDIENAYFEELVKIENDIINYLKTVKTSTHKRISGELRQFIDIKKKEIIKLNVELSDIKNELKQYLKTIKISHIKEIRDFFDKNFIRLNVNKSLLIINFNYTTTINSYLDLLSNRGYKVNILNIHGDLNENIIFGYGNDHDKDYQIMNELQIDEFLENFKTFEYINNNRYSKLFKNYIPSLGAYNVIVIGHSLQQTDKTLLSGIFNNSECKEIHLLKRGDLDETERLNKYRKLTFAMSRIIKSQEDELRLKVIDFESVKAFP